MACVSSSRRVDPIPGVTVEIDREGVWIRSAVPLGVVTSAPVGGELSATRHVVNMRVPDGYRGEQPAEDLAAFARRRGIREPFVGLMTAAATHEAAVVTETDEAATVTAVVTVGLGSPVAAGRSPKAPWRPATINTIVLVDARLERAAAVNGVIGATEAKTGALADAGVRTADGLPATGTATDAVVVAWTGREPVLEYLGPVAPGGWLLARAVRRAVTEGVARA
jgi:adenosylcobinamide hydrolase